MAKTTRESETALITGASAGIGTELARCFAAGGHDLVLTARREDRLLELGADLERTYGVTVVALPADLLEPDAPTRLHDQLSRRSIRVDTLVNNAGVTSVGSFHDTEPQTLARLVQLNVASLVGLSALLVPGMVERGHGRVLNVASVAGFQPVPSMAVYAASKAFVLSLSEAQSEELRGTGVTVTALCPGLTDTDMVRDALDDRPEAELLPSFLVMSPRRVAEAGYRACMSGKVLEVPGMANEWMTQWTRLQPRWLVRMMGGFAARAFEPRT